MEASIINVDSKGGGDFLTIQEAIDNASIGVIIKIWAGTYNENIIVNKSITLRGNGSINTTIIGINFDDVVEIAADWVNITNFSVIGSTDSGIKLNNSKNCKIANINCSNNSGYGIFILNSSNNNITNCTISSNYYGIYHLNSQNNFLINNNISKNKKYGLYVYNSNNISINYNNISFNGATGSLIYHSHDNKISENNIFSNFEDGLTIESSQNNKILNNNIFSNNKTAITMFFSENNYIGSNNLFYNNLGGIYSYVVNNNTIDGNNIYSNYYGGMYLLYSENYTIKNNYILNNSNGLEHRGSFYSQIFNNTFINNNILILSGFKVRDYFPEYVTHNISNNTVNGKEIYYYKNLKDIKIPSDAGEIILVNCSDIIINNTNCSDGDIGIEITYSANITINDSKFINNNYYGAYAFNNNNTNFLNNKFYKNHYGIFIFLSNNTNINYNNVLYNYYGIVCKNHQEIHFNNIYGNTFYGVYPLTGAICVNASYNWWGDKSGPYHDLDNPTGKGDNVSSTLIFKPWLIGNIDNKPPNIDTIDKKIAVEDIYYGNIYSASDPNKDLITWKFDSNASWLNWGPENHTLYGIPTNADVGSYWVCINITDDFGGYDQHYFNLTVLNVNPSILTINILTVVEDTVYYNDYNSTDDEQGNITWNLVTNGTWLAIDSNTGILRGEPKNIDVGQYWVNVSVNDGNGGVEFSNFTLVVINVNDAPIIGTKDIITIKEDIYYEVIYNAIEIDIGDILTWVYESNASWLHWGSQNLTLYGTPNNDDVGSYWVRINVSDRNGGYDEHYFTLTVINTNDAPIIETQDQLTAIEDEYYEVNYSAIDIDIGDTLTWTINTNAYWLHWGLLNHTLYGTPRNEDVGEYWVKIIVDDNIDIDFTNFILTVLNVNDPPTIKGAPTSLRVNALEDIVLDLSPYVYDIDNNSSELTLETNSEYIITDGLNIIFNYPNSVTYENVKITVSDGIYTSDPHFIIVTIIPKVIDHPTIIEKFPTGINVPVNTNITIIFSELMDHSSLKTAFSLLPLVNGEFSWTDNIMTFNPTTDLLYNTKYTVTIDTIATNYEGITLETIYSWNFTTESVSIKEIDTDGDDIPDIDDKDDDNDGIFDIDELAKKTDPLLWDTDGDGHSDSEDDYPLDKTRWKKEVEMQNIDMVVLIATIIIIIIVVFVSVSLFLIKYKKINKIKNTKKTEIELPSGKQLEKLPFSQQQSHKAPQITQPLQQKYCSTCGQSQFYIRQKNSYYCNYCKKFE